MKTFREFITEELVDRAKLEMKKVFFDDNASKWNVSSKIVSAAKVRGYTFVGVFRPKTFNGASEGHLFYDRSLKQPNNGKELVLRYGTETTIATGQLPIVKLNLLKNTVKFSDGESFETTSTKVNYLRLLSDFAQKNAPFKWA